MFDANQSWQSETFKKMLNYERENSREKFIYEVNQLLNAYHKFYKLYCNGIYDNCEEYLSFLQVNDDPQLLALVFSLISITHNKDDLSNYIKNEDLSDFMSSSIKTNDEYNSNVFAHSFRRMRQKTLNIGEKFTIPEETLTVITYDENWNENRIFNLDDWKYIYDSKVISVSDGIITSVGRGCIILECVNEKYDQIRRIKINSGDIKQAHISEFFFTQIRNIIAHGRFSFINSGAYDTLEEYNSFNMNPSDNRYLRGTQREVIIYDNNQLNIAYGGDNSFNPRYITNLAKILYNKDDVFFKFIDIFDKNHDYILQIKNHLKDLSEKEKNDFMALILLSKFYINFIYNYDSFDKNNYNYDLLPISNELKGSLNNHEFIYQIRTAIMHGRYEYQDNKINFWNFSKDDSTKKSFDVTISYDELISMFVAKEENFYKNMKYDPKYLKNVEKHNRSKI